MATVRRDDVTGHALKMMNFNDILYHPESPRSPNMFKTGAQTKARPVSITVETWKDRYRPSTASKSVNSDHFLRLSPANLHCINNSTRARSSYASSDASHYSSSSFHSNSSAFRGVASGRNIPRTRKLGQVNFTPRDVPTINRDLLLTPDITSLIDYNDNSSANSDLGQSDASLLQYNKYDYYLSPNIQSPSRSELSSASSYYRKKSAGLIRGYDNYKPRKEVTIAWTEVGPRATSAQVHERSRVRMNFLHLLGNKINPFCNFSY